MSAEDRVAQPELDFVCTFCSRSVFKDGTIDLNCGYCSRKTAWEIEQEAKASFDEYLETLPWV